MVSVATCKLLQAINQSIIESIVDKFEEYDRLKYLLKHIFLYLSLSAGHLQVRHSLMLLWKQ